MITKPTVLVLGAGVSNAYSFHQGRDLLFEVLDRGEYLESWSDPDYSGWSDSHRPPEIDFLVLKKETALDLLAGFSAAVRNSQLASIDRFLEMRPEFLLIGKVLIAEVLIEQEDARNLLPKREQLRIYEYLWNSVYTTNPQDLRKNQLSIISFNYDRSLEYSFFNAILSSYPGMSRELASELLVSIPIIHVYGQLGRPDFEKLRGARNDTRYRPYDTDYGIPALEACIAEIKLVGERQEDSEEFVKAREILKQAGRIAFLGFGYDETNLYRLGKDRSFGGVATRIYGTVRGLGANEVKSAYDQIEQYRASPRSASIHTELIPCDVLELLRDRPILG